MNFDPGDVGRKGSLFGFPFSPEEADLVILPIPWDVTASYRSGSSAAPLGILEASPQLDFSIPGLVKPWRFRSALLPESLPMKKQSEEWRAVAIEIIHALENGLPSDSSKVNKVNTACEQMVNTTREIARQWRALGKQVAVLGGDHSTPLGLLQALGEEMEFGILQIDAHMDLRETYEGFTYSHASIMYNALKLPAVKALIQVGIRDYSEQELLFGKEKGVQFFFDHDIKRSIFQGRNWDYLCDRIVDTLPQNVYISLDIDGLDPGLCPNTGTPVPGGLSFSETDYLLRKIAVSGKKIIGFDLNEVVPGTEWDAMVGARVLYLLTTYMGVSQGKITMTEERI